MPTTKKQPVLLKNYLAMIRNSLGTKMFRNYFLPINEAEKDVLKNGRLSCAVYVSSILILNNLIQGPPRGPHAIVKSLMKNMEDSGWRKTQKPCPGAILIWEPMKTGEHLTDHIGFFWKKNQAISNRFTTRTPEIHHWTYGKKKGRPARKITAIYWHSKLG